MPTYFAIGTITGRGEGSCEGVGHLEVAGNRTTPDASIYSRKAGRMSMGAGSEGLQYRVLGGTGEKVSAIGIGGWHLGLPHGG